MARIPYPDTSAPALAPLVERIRRERGGKLLNLYRMLLHSPPLAQGWLGLFTAIRQQGELPERARELAIMRIAVLNGADYEFRAHVPFALAAGLDHTQLEALKAGETPAGLTAADRAVLAYTDAMTRSVRVPDDVFAAVRATFPERQLVELTATVGGYNLVSRFLEALQVDHD
ncbi:MAG: carboxymuconolactone decarboxylase family protein [Burkholderiales bacterium]|nr:carboxymuconolactone decarboxylase family protein [Burkholderiales bacterium]